MLQTTQIPMAEQLQRRLVRVWLVERLDQPNVVVVLVRVRGHLQTMWLLITYSPPFCSCSTHLLLPCSVALGIEMRVRVQIAPASLVILDGHQGAVGHIPRHAGIVERVAHEARLEGGAVEAIAIAAAIEHAQMDVEEERVEQHGPHDQSEGTARDLLQCLHNGLFQIPQDEPQFAGRVQTHQQHHKQPDKLH